MVKIYADDDMTRPVHHCSASLGDVIIQAANSLEDPKQMLCPNEECGMLLVQIREIKFNRAMFAPKKCRYEFHYNNEVTAYRCPHCQTEIEEAQLKKLGVL